MKVPVKKMHEAPLFETVSNVSTEKSALRKDRKIKSLIKDHQDLSEVEDSSDNEMSDMKVSKLARSQLIEEEMEDIPMDNLYDIDLDGNQNIERAPRQSSKAQNLSEPKEKGDLSLIELYGEMGKWLSRYRSGKVLKGLKLIPQLESWEEALYYMNPSEWTPAAHLEATKIFISNLKPNQAQKYLEFVLLPAVRENIYEHKKLSFHLYEALKKSLYKPQAFF
jgi:essential nuclear protein 1